MTELERFIENYHNHTKKELIEMFPSFSVDKMYKLATMYNLKKDVDVIKRQGSENARHPKSIAHRFGKGHTPANKGKKMEEYLNKETIAKIKSTQFKKGNTPKNYQPNGSVRMTKDGIVQIKVEHPNKWKNIAALVYENFYGVIPEGHFVRSKDGNINNVNPSNLFLVDKLENMVRNSYQHKDERTNEDMMQCRILQSRIKKELKNK